MSAKPYKAPRTDPVPLHDLDNVRRIRRDIEALLYTYDEVKHVWPTGTGEMWAQLHDGRRIEVTLKISAAKGLR